MSFSIVEGKKVFVNKVTISDKSTMLRLGMKDKWQDKQTGEWKSGEKESYIAFCNGDAVKKAEQLHDGDMISITKATIKCVPKKRDGAWENVTSVSIFDFDVVKKGREQHQEQKPNKKDNAQDNDDADLPF